MAGAPLMTEEQMKVELMREDSRREMMRRSLDTIRIFNPLDHPFRFYWDSFPWVVPAQGTKDVPRYIAMHYFKKMSDTLIGQQLLAQGAELLAMREKQFGKRFNDKYEENTEVWDRVPKLNDPELMAAVMERVILGVIEEYGLEQLPVAGDKLTQLDYRSDHDAMFDRLLSGRASQRVQETPSVQAKVTTKLKPNEVTHE